MIHMLILCLDRTGTLPLRRGWNLIRLPNVWPLMSAFAANASPRSWRKQR